MPSSIHRARDLARDEGLAAQRALVVEQNAVGRVRAVRLAVVDRDPVRVQLGRGVRAARVERCGLALRRLARPAVQLRGRGLVEAHAPFHAEDAQRLEQAQGAERVGVRGVLGGLEAHLDMALRRQVVDLVRLRLLHQADQVGGVGQVAVVQEKARGVLVGVHIKVIDPAGVERRGAPLDPVHNVPCSSRNGSR
jgi:hypothetical protein